MPNATGNYQITARVAFIDTAPLPLGQVRTGQIESEAALDQWTFTATANQQLRLDVLGTTAPVRFRLVGPNGWIGFTGLTTDSDPVTLPANGDYTLEVDGPAGAYSFTLNELVPTALTLGTPLTETLAGTNAAKLYQFTTTTTDPLRVRLTANTATDKLELYLRRGVPPTRKDYDLRSVVNAATQVLEVPTATPDTWYALVYSTQATAGNTYTLTATTSPVFANTITPTRSATGLPTTLTLTGAGFVVGTTVELVAGSTVIPTTVSIDAFDRLTASANLLGVNAGTYDVRVRRPDNATDTLPGAFTVTAAGQAELVTRLLLPNAFGRHATATIFLEYENTGNAAMAAPILIVQSGDADGSDKPLLTLDQANLTQGFWTSATPDGFASSVQIYATGAQPGVLLPGELVRVPIYYAGLQQPWNFADNQVEMEVRVHEAGNTEAIDWNSLKPTLQPTGMNAETWDPVFANLQTQVGPTWGDYVRRLGDLATALDRLGRKVTNVTELFAFQSMMANGLPVTPTLAAAVDGAVPSPGMTIAFARSFGNTIQERYAIGPFGRGWSLGWNVYAETLADGTVIVHEAADRQRRYQPDSRSTTNYFSQEGDTATLKKLAGGILQLTDSGGSTLRFTANGQLDYMQDVNNNRITAGYTAGRLTSLTHSAGGSLLITYNTAGRITSLAESTGNVTTFTYDASNEHLLSVTSPQGTITYSYDTGTNLAKRHALASVTDANGVTTTFTYDNAGRLSASEQTGGLQRTTYSYDTVGRVLLTDAAGVTARLAFDHRGLLARSEDSAGDYLRYDYDADGFLRTQTDSLGRTQTYNWCGCGSLLSVTDPLGATTSFTKGGPNNQPLSFTDAKGNLTAYQYDTAGNRTRTTYADGTSESATYTAAGLLASITNRRSQTVQIGYNGFGQVTSELYPDNSTTTYTYDSQQRLHTATNAAGTITFTYDSADRVTNIAYPGSRWLSFAYDAGGRRTQMIDHTGFVTKYGYDTAGRLVTLKDATDTVLVTYAYDVAGRLIREDKANGTVTTNDFDTLGRLLKITNKAPGGAVNSLFEYGYDAQGRRTSMTTSDGTWTYTYDVVGQLTRAMFAPTNGSIPSQDFRYEFDLLGNRTRTIVNGVTTNYAGNAMNQYTSAGSTTYTYDLDGNVIAESGPGGTKTFTYDVLNRLTRVETPTSVTTYEYDLFGHRTATVVDGVRTEYLIDPFGMGDVVGEYNAGGVRQASYTRGLGLEAVQGTSGLNFYDFDALGSTSGVTSTAGNYVDRYAYDPFGGNLFRSETTNNAFEYIGQYGVTTEANGLHFMRARFYDATTGRFNSQDPLRLGGGDANLYRYAANNPNRFIDPEGLSSCSRTPAQAQAIANLAYPNSPKEHYVASNLGDDLPGLQDRLFELKTAQGLGPQDNATGSVRSGWKFFTRHVQAYAEAYLYMATDTFSYGFYQAGYNPLRPLDCKDIPVTQFSPHPPSTAGATGGTSTANSVDPNEKFGAAGVGSQAFIAPNATIPYRINFENLGPGSVPPPTTPATAPAQRVEITDQLSPNLDWNSIQFTGFGYGDVEHAFDGEAPFQAVTLPMTYNGVTFNVDVEMSIEPTTGMVRVVFQSVDPLTFLPPDVLSGFLPPEDGTGRGKGYVTFNAKPRAGLATGTEIRNVALIRFDGQTVIATNQIDPQDASAGTDPNKEARNTIDATPPMASINLVPQYSKTPQFTVSWGGHDGNGAGIDTFDVYYAVDGGPWQAWLNDTSDGAALFTGELGKTYSFVAVGKDLVGNEQALPAMAQATVRVGVTPTAVDDSFVVTPGKELKGTVATNDARSKLPHNATVVTAPTQGTLTLNANGTFVYVPNETSTGRDFFTYRWSSDTSTSNIARVDLATHLASFSKPKVSVGEKKGATTLTVSLNTPATATLIVNYVVKPATAKSSDYTLASGQLTFAEGERTKTITVTIHDDVFDEANETLQVWLTETMGPVAVGKNRMATVTITDDDATPKVSFQTKSATSTEGTSATVEVFLNVPSGQPIEVTYGLLKSSKATKDSDFTLPATLQLTFQPGETSKVIPISVLDDLTEEADETVLLRLLNATNAKIAGNPTHTHTIRASDPERTVSFQTSSTTVTEGVTTISVVVQLSVAAAFDVKVNYTIDAAGLTATAKKDFVLKPGTLTFKPGETEKTIVIRILDDVVVEPTESLTVRLSTPTNAVLGPTDAFTVTLNDNEV